MIPTITPAIGLFSQLVPLLEHRAILITVSKLDEGDVLQVNLCPRQLKEGENQALTAPLCVTGTAAELDAEFVPQISSFVASHASLNSNLAQIQKEIEEAEKTAREEAKKKQKTVGNGGKKVPESTSSAQAMKTESVPAPPMLSLFDQAAPAPTTEPPAQTLKHSD